HPRSHRRGRRGEPRPHPGRGRLQHPARPERRVRGSATPDRRSSRVTSTDEIPAIDVANAPIEVLAQTFHVFDPVHALWPSTVMNRLLNECPVARSQVFEGGYWVVTK